MRKCTLSIISYHRNISIAIILLVCALAASCSDTSRNSSSKKKLYRVIQVHLIHRHGDRSPITPMKNEFFWSSELIPQNSLQKMDTTTQIIRDHEEKDDTQHLAAGRGPFGQLTQLGLLQMVKLGMIIREQLLEEEKYVNNNISNTHQLRKNGVYDNNENSNCIIEKLFHTTKNPLLPSKVQVWSTDFPRTIQSIQGTLMGLFPEDNNNDSPTSMEVDVRHTSIMIPDPQPRNSQEQSNLESLLSQRPYILEKEREQQSLKDEFTSKLLPFLNEEEAFGISFGIGEEKDLQKSPKQKKSLSWTQILEIIKCLKTRDLLPEDILTPKMQQIVTEFCAWKWFSVLRHDRLAYLAMHPFCDHIVQRMNQLCLKVGTEKESKAKATKKQLYLYSAHDSTLIGLLCAFHLEKPAKWPEYGSYFKAELLQRIENDNCDELLVRFSLNNKVLKSEWSDDHDDNKMISLDQLAYHIATSGSSPPSSTI